MVGREAELRVLSNRLDELAAPRGGVVALVGDAGSGKSRLLAATLSGADALVIAGRAVPGDSPVPYRPLAEAFLSAFRSRPVPFAPSLAGFEGQLARLVPGWSAGSPAEESPVLLGEAVVRLLGVLAVDRPCVLVLEDLHWADAETLAVVDYLGDALRSEPALCLVTSRRSGAATDLLDRFGRRDASALLPVEVLDAEGVRTMVSACLGGAEPPAGLSEFVEVHSDGSPFLVEELLAGLSAVGALRLVGTRWEVTGALSPSVPGSLQASIGRRLGSLDATARRVLAAAALLGRQFEWELLPGISQVDGRAVVDRLRSAVDEQLIQAGGDGFRFRHALTREAVLADLLPPERLELAARALQAVERANPELPGPTCQLAADLAEAAGEPVVASARLVECARRALASGALATAEATARRAGNLAEGDEDAVGDADEVLVQVLAAAGHPAEALARGWPLVDRFDAAGVGASRRVDLLVSLGRAALAGGDVDAADTAVGRARATAGATPDPLLLARIDAIAAEAALDRGELAAAEALCQRAVEGAEATDQPEVRCEALLVLGRTLRPQGLDRSRSAFARAAEVAEVHGLDRWHLRAQQELSLDDFEGEGVDGLIRTRDLAARYGAHITVAVMDLIVADLALAGYDQEGCVRSAAACMEASRRYGLSFEPVAALWLAGAHALAGDDHAMEAALGVALAPDPDDPRILADRAGRVLLGRAFVRDELDAVADLVDEMMVHVRRAPPTTSVFVGRTTWALLHTIDDGDHGAAVRAEYHAATSSMGLAALDLFGEVVEAVALGRTGASEAATVRIAPAYEQLVASPLGQGVIRSNVLLLARAATRDGWGEPVRWLRECEAWFAAHDYGALVRRSRALLGEAGAAVPRKGRGDSEVPESLRALGVTSRETDVLKLVVARRSNKEIAAELHLSPKTVERHLSSLFDRTGVRNRQDLAEVGEAHLA